MFLFECKKVVNNLPIAIDEGHFKFFERAAIDELPIPETDRSLLWPYYDKYKKGFIGLRANCDPSGQLAITEELKI